MEEKKNEIIVQIITGAIGGLAISVAGLMKASKKEKFDWKKMAPTIVVAGVIGGIAGYLNQDYGVVANGALAGGVTNVVENLFKAVYRKLL